MSLADACALISFHGASAAPMSPAGRLAMQGGDVAVSAVTVYRQARTAA